LGQGRVGWDEPEVDIMKDHRDALRNALKAIASLTDVQNKLRAGGFESEAHSMNYGLSKLDIAAAKIAENIPMKRAHSIMHEFAAEIEHTGLPQYSGSAWGPGGIKSADDARKLYSPTPND
jgi:hypothetical protein